MKRSILLLFLSTCSLSGAWSPPTTVHHKSFHRSKTALSMNANPDGDVTDNHSVVNKKQRQQSNKPWNKVLSTAATTALMTATVWSSQFEGFSTTGDHHFMMSMQPPAAMAKEMASGTGSRVNKDPESLLRYGLPINNKEVRKLQATLEGIKQDIGSKRKSAALDGAKKSKTIISGSGSKIASSCREAKVCQDALERISAGLDPLSDALKDSMDAFQGSDQERTALDKAYAAQKSVVDELNLIEEQMIPAGYKTPVPEEYSDLPQLQGRATVEMVIQKADGSTFDVNGNTFPEAKLKMIIDGYAAPITSGNFIELVQKGFYTKMPIQRSDGFVVQTGDPDGEAVGYVAKGSKSVGNGKNGERLIPLEIFIQGDKGPFYESSMEDEGRGGQATVLPFSSYGAMGWAREEYDVNSGSSQFFWLLFDSDLTPAGKNVLDGRYPCFGYVVDGADFLSAVTEGDIIVSAKVTQGAENLVLPSS